MRVHSGSSEHNGARSTMQSAQPRRKQRNCNNRVGWGRLLFLLSLCAAGAVLGYLTYYYIKSAEEDQAEGLFLSLADRALHESATVFRQKRLGLCTMASMIGEFLPNASHYPFVTVPGFELMTTNLIDATSNEDMVFFPIVPVEELEEWEEFAYNFYF